MKQIKIYEEEKDSENFVYVLEEIIKQIRNGNTSGVDPTWEFEEVQE